MSNFIVYFSFAIIFDSRGCIHVHPEDMKEIDRILAELGVKIRPNTLGKLPYPYKQQGILSVEEIESWLQ